MIIFGLITHITYIKLTVNNVVVEHFLILSSLENIHIVYRYFVRLCVRIQKNMALYEGPAWAAPPTESWTLVEIKGGNRKIFVSVGWEWIQLPHLVDLCAMCVSA